MTQRGGLGGVGGREVQEGDRYLVAKLCLTLCDPFHCSTPGYVYTHSWFTSLYSRKNTTLLSDYTPIIIKKRSMALRRRKLPWDVSRGLSPPSPWVLHSPMPSIGWVGAGGWSAVFLSTVMWLPSMPLNQKILLLKWFIFWLHLEACKIFIPWLGIEPVLPAVDVQSPNHWATREVSKMIFKGVCGQRSLAYCSP